MLHRNTIQRDMVFKSVTTLQCHATAEEIYTNIAKEYPNIGRGTVYRNLNQLAASGKIQKIEVPGGADCYDHQCHEHYHARCLKCGKVYDVDMPYIADFEKTVKEPLGFKFSGHDIIFKGICKECNE